MKYICSLVTPLGTGKVAYGHFMSGDDRSKLYHCWWNGCGIGGESKTLKAAQSYLLYWVITRLEEGLADLHSQYQAISTCQHRLLAHPRKVF